MAYFNYNFKRQGNQKYIYVFETLYTQTKENRNETHPLAVDGMVIDDNKTVDYSTVPENLQDSSLCKKVYTQWLMDCSGAFVKAPTLEQCLAKSESIVDPNLSIATVFPEEEEKDWILQWLPTKIKVDTPLFQIYWSPSYKILYNKQITLDEVEVQNPEKTYTIIPQTSRTFAQPETNTEWVQELSDLYIPYADSSTLRLNSDVEAQKDKLRNKIREARIRAKLAKYRVERMATRFEEKFGFYPEEDKEEAQTEVESNSDE